MDGQNFQNGQYDQNAQPVSTYTYQDNSSAYSSEVYDSTGTESEGGTPGLAIAGLVFGIIGIVTLCCGCPSIICGIVGLIMAIVANKQKKSGVGTAALICSIIAIVVGCVASLFTTLPALLAILEEM